MNVTGSSNCRGYGRCTCCRQKGGKLKVTLVYNVREVLYDVSNMAWVQGDLIDSHDYDHVRHLVQDIIEDGNRDRVMRVMRLAFAEAEGMLQPWSKIRFSGSVYLDNEPEDEDELVMLLSVPAKTDRGTIELILQLVHEWLVCRILQDWLSITWPEGAAVWAVKIEELREAIRNAKNRSQWITRRKLSPW